jgi:hypothetical protein
VPVGANDSVALGVPGSVVYTDTVGEALPGLCMRQIDGLSDPSPLQASSVNKSPLSGSMVNDSGHVKFGATVRMTAPVAVLIWSTAPVVKLPVVEFNVV